MKKIILAIIIAILSFTGLNALGGIKYIGEGDNRYDCWNDFNGIYQYPKLESKIDSLFKKIENKDLDYRKKLYSRIEDIALKYLKKIGRKYDDKRFLAIGNIACKSAQLNYELENSNPYKINNKEDFIKKILSESDLETRNILKKYIKFYEFGNRKNFKAMDDFDVVSKLGNEYFYIDYSMSGTDLITQLMFNQNKTKVYNVKYLYGIDKKIAKILKSNFNVLSIKNIGKNFDVIIGKSSRDFEKLYLFVFKEGKLFKYKNLQLQDNTVTGGETAPCKIESLMESKTYSFKIICNDGHPRMPKFEHFFGKNGKFDKTITYYNIDFKGLKNISGISIKDYLEGLKCEGIGCYLDEQIILIKNKIKKIENGFYFKGNNELEFFPGIPFSGAGEGNVIKFYNLKDFKGIITFSTEFFQEEKTDLHMNLVFILNGKIYIKSLSLNDIIGFKLKWGDVFSEEVEENYRNTIIANFEGKIIKDGFFKVDKQYENIKIFNNLKSKIGGIK